MKLGAYLNQRTETKNTALHLACINGQVNVLRALLAHIAQLSTEEQMACLAAKNNVGHTPLDVVVARKSNPHYMDVSAETDKLCSRILVNAIQRLVNLTVFKIKKIPKIADLPQDQITDIIEFNMPRFAFSDAGMILVGVTILKATLSPKINDLAKQYQKQMQLQKQIEMSTQSKTVLDIKTNADYQNNRESSLIMFNNLHSVCLSNDIKDEHDKDFLLQTKGAATAGTMTTVTAAGVITPAATTASSAALATAATSNPFDLLHTLGDPQAKLDLDNNSFRSSTNFSIAPDGEVIVNFSVTIHDNPVLPQQANAKTLAFKTRRLAEIDYAVDQYAKKIKDFENGGNNHSKELHEAFGLLQEHADLARLFIKTAKNEITSTLYKADCWKNYNKALQRVIGRYEEAILPSQLFTITFS